MYDLSQSIDQLKAAGLEVQGIAQMESIDSGLKITARKNANKEKWPTLRLPINTANEFDVSVEFADLEIRNATDWGCLLDLQIDFDDVEKSSITLGIKRDKADDLFVLAQRMHEQPHGKRRYEPVQLFEPFADGTLRIVRHAGELYCIAAAKGKPHQVIGSFTVGERIVSKITVVAKSAKNPAELDGVLEKISVKVAE